MAFFCVLYRKEECDGCGGCEKNAHGVMQEEET